MTAGEADSLSARCGHAGCLLCGEGNPWSQGLRFRAASDGSVETTFAGHPRLQGYEGILHGGVIAALLDAAMTHCLFHHGVRGLTGDLHVRYLRPVSCKASLAVRAWIVSGRPPLYRLRSELLLGGSVAARAYARFMAREEPARAEAAPAGEG
jgi:uncharacterized protein (TIGR00369 family)